MTIDRAAIAAANEPINALIDWAEPSAIALPMGPLSDVTVGIKANIAVEGLPWTAGMIAHRTRIAERDAETVARLRAAGAIILGTLNLEEAALGAKTDNPWFGATQNPHHIGYTPGGSSGGSGAAVAAGLCDLALGTDTMGSIRIPAAYCGVYGFKPANARVSQHGLEPADPSLDCIGPLARDLGLLEWAARVISDFGEGLVDGPVLTLASLGGVECDDAVLAAYRKACGILAPAGEIALAEPLTRIRFAGFIRTSTAMAGHLADIQTGGMSANLTKLLTYGPRRKAEDRAGDEAILAKTREILRTALGNGAVLLMPTTPQSAFPHNESAPANQADFTCLANIAGLPTVCLPAGWTDDGLPLGVQIMGAEGREAGLFALARKLDEALKAHRRPAHYLKKEGRS
jgi:aspartyl-tRNA(Asn)/glutamyl-tRNA(Gln) amidotransferase subunit A